MKNQDLSVLKALLLREMDGGMCEKCAGPMYEGVCTECGWMEEGVSFTKKYNDNPILKGKQKNLPDELQAQIVGEASEKNISYLAGYADGALQGYDKGYMDCLNKKPYNVTGITSPKNESKIAENDDSVKHVNSAPNKQPSWIDQFDSALNAKLKNEPDSVKAKAKEALELMGDSCVIYEYGTFQPYVAVDPFLGDIDELISHYTSGLIKTRVGGIVFKKTCNTNGSKVEYQPYSLIDKKNVDTAFYYDPEDIQQRADDYTAPKGGTISTQFESEDHEVSMANNSIDSILWAANELKKYLGDEERDIPAWIQDHITNAENYILQAAKNFHDYGHEEDSEEEYGDEDTQDMSLASLMEAKKKPSAGLTKKQKSAIAKKAKAGKDVGKKGKGFEKVAAKAAKKYGSKERGQKVAAAAMWKAAASKAKK